MPMLFHGTLARRLSPVTLPLLAALVLANCGDDPVQPVAARGAYTATTFTGTSNGATVDVLAAGGSLTIVLTPQGTTTGRLFIPGAVTGEGDFDLDLTGTYTQNDGIVEFSHTADTFVRDMPFTVRGATLVGDRTFADIRIRVTLTRVP